MRMNFLKIALLGLLPSLAFAGTLARPYGASDYAAGTKAVGSKINAEFANVQNWLNGSNISANNIAPLGIATANIAAGAITPAKMSPVNIMPAGTGSTFTSSNVIAQDYVSGTFTGTGRPIMLRFQGNAFAEPASFKVAASTISDFFAVFEFYRDNQYIGSQSFGISKNSVESNLSITIPASSISQLDNIPYTAGAHTYKVKLRVSNPAATFTSPQAIVLYIYEL